MELMLLLPLVLVVAGLTLIVAAYYVRMQAKEAEFLIQQLVHLDAEAKNDPIEFIRLSLDWLKRAGADRVHVRLNWFGEMLQLGDDVSHLPSEQLEKLCEMVAVGEGEVQATILICPNRQLRGEREALFQIVKQLWLRLVAAQINGRVAQLHLSQQQMQRYEMFYKHDLKNLAQFLTLLNSQINRCDDAECGLKLVNRLRDILPSLEHRAQRILRFLTQKNVESAEQQTFPLAERVHLVAKMVGITVHVEGDATLKAYEALFEQGLQGVLENFVHHAETPEPIDVTIEDQGMGIVMRLRSEAMREPLSAEQRVRMFEPFWTTSESGLGLGLYLARQNFTRACHGRLDAVNMPDGGWAFELVCPKG